LSSICAGAEPGNLKEKDMTDRLAGLKAGVLAKLGFAAAADASTETIIDPNATADTGASNDSDEDEIDPKAGKKKMPPADCDADADAAAEDAALAAAMTETATAAATAATAAANARWAAVLASAEADGRLALATNLLGTTSMSAEQIAAALAAAPKAGAGGLSARMADVNNPAITADSDAAAKPKAGNHGWDKAQERVFGSNRKKGA
jgi:hypothetical protein